MPRLFVAIDPPADIKTRLIAAMDGVAGARWQTAAQLHLTLRFIGDISDETAGRIAQALAAIDHPRFDLTVSGSGAFENALWAALAPNPALSGLQAKIEAAMVMAGLAPEARAYIPHITLARLNRGADCQTFLDRTRDLACPPFAVTEFCLYDSQLTPDGSVYTIIGGYPLY
ncbi:RNA 2',3'-cyclic phosphodiesterase [Asticcacaulis solisilvae]|uniref:RNA 2',3'-cyclic phosphodiesterase n=1 Tax=Asticcacaulis solisilvae TaxID=1217274 RepID=UPI003FD81A7E